MVVFPVAVVTGQGVDRISICKFCSYLFWTATVNEVLSFLATAAYFVYDHCRMAGQIWPLRMEGKTHKEIISGFCDCKSRNHKISKSAIQWLLPPPELHGGD
jgi:hypothetical protein